jgi:hypothetical protein
VNTEIAVRDVEGGDFFFFGGLCDGVGLWRIGTRELSGVTDRQEAGRSGWKEEGGEGAGDRRQCGMARWAVKFYVCLWLWYIT